MRIKIIFLFHINILSTLAQVPPGFAYVKDMIPSIQVDLRYFSQQNFLGTQVDGYKKNIAILTIEATQALKNVQNELFHENLSILIFCAISNKFLVPYIFKSKHSTILLSVCFTPRLAAK